MEVMLFVNDAFQGQKTKKLKTTQVRAYVVGFDKLDSVELVQGDTILAGQYDFPSDESYSGCVDFMFGWGKKHVRTSWDIQVDIIDGVLLDVSPRLRGIDMVDPLDTPENAGDSLPRFTRSEHGACFRIVTDGNSNAVTDSSQGFVLDIEGNERTKVKLQFRACWGDIVENRTLIFSIDDLRHRSTSEYVHGFVSPAVAIGRFCARGEVICKIERDFQLSSFQAVYLRAYQQNGDCVFSSPISFVE